MKTAAISLLLCVSGFLFGQESHVAVVDDSQKDCPLVLSGQAKVTDNPAKSMRYTLEVNLSARNVSTKDILLVVAEINARSAVFNVHGTRSDDYFFESGDFSPLTTESISFSTQSAQPKIMYPSSEPLSVSSEIAFVQFADGSTWGDRAAAQDALRIRRLTSLQLTNLADIYRIAGEKGFVGELMKPSELPVIGILQRACGTDGKDVKTVAMMVQDMLELARSRQLPDSGILRSAFFQAQQWH